METKRRSKVLKLNTHRQAMERSRMEMGVDDARGFLLSAYYFILLCLPMAYSKQPKALITNKDYHAVLSTKLLLKERLDRSGYSTHAGGY
jgi:hypothetical protein